MDSQQLIDLVEKLKDAFLNLENQDELQDMKQTAKEAADMAADFVRKYPIQSVLGAAAIGFVLASIANKRKSL